MVTGRVYYLIYLYRSANQASVFPKQQERLQLDRLKNQLSDAIQRYGAVQKVGISLASTVPYVSLETRYMGVSVAPRSVGHLHRAAHVQFPPSFLTLPVKLCIITLEYAQACDCRTVQQQRKRKTSVLLQAVYLLGASTVPLD